MNARMAATEILQLVLRHRRSAAQGACDARPCRACIAEHLPRIESFIRRGEPIRFVLPAFPAKSPNLTKVLGPLPDMAERIALGFLQNLCCMIESLYSAGAKLTICSDGRVFSELVRVPDADITAYGRELKAIIRRLRADTLEVFNLEDEFADGDFDAIRAKLIAEYGEPIEVLRAGVRAGGPDTGLYNGISRFLFEDMVVLDPHKSRSAVRKECGELAYGVIQRSRAWGALVSARYPDAVRLSIHPQPCRSEKIGLHMVETADNWLTPWHSTAVDVGGQFVLMKRSEAENLGASLVLRDGRPSHFVNPVVYFGDPATCLPQHASTPVLASQPA